MTDDLIHRRVVLAEDERHRAELVAKLTAERRTGFPPPPYAGEADTPEAVARRREAIS